MHHLLTRINLILLKSNNCCPNLSCSWLCCIALNELNKLTKIHLVWQDSKLIKDLIRILIEAHTKLIRNRLPHLVGDDCQAYRVTQAKLCIGLLNILRAAANKEDEEVLRHQERVSFD